MPEYRVGDIVRFTRTGRVGHVQHDGFELEDAQNGRKMFVIPNDGTLKVEMVKRAPEMHNDPKPEQGTVIKGRDIKRIWWKRGTIFRLVYGDVGGLVLREDGLLYPLSNVSDPDGIAVYPFEKLADDARFELVFVA